MAGEQHETLPALDAVRRVIEHVGAAKREPAVDADEREPGERHGAVEELQARRLHASFAAAFALSRAARLSCQNHRTAAASSISASSTPAELHAEPSLENCPYDTAQPRLKT